MKKKGGTKRLLRAGIEPRLFCSGGIQTSLVPRDHYLKARQEDNIVGDISHRYNKSEGTLLTQVCRASHNLLVRFCEDRGIYFKK